MSGFRNSRRSRQKDQEIHEALLAGLTPQQVAGRFGIATEQVAAADHRVRRQREKLSLHEAALQTHLSALRALTWLALTAYHGSAAELEESTQVSTDSAKPGHKAQRATKKKRAEATYLRIALAALNRQEGVLQLRGQASDPPAAEAPNSVVPVRSVGQEFADRVAKQAKQHPELHRAYTDALKDLLAGQKVSHLKLPWEKPADDSTTS